MIPLPTIGRIPDYAEIRRLAPELAAAAAAVHEGWMQVDGWDEELGEGGICDLVADAMVEVLSKAGIEDAMSIPAGVGENHVYVVALLDDGVYAIDIAPSVYEIGSGFVWKKREGIEIVGSDVDFLRLGDRLAPEDFVRAYTD